MVVSGNIRHMCPSVDKHQADCLFKHWGFFNFFLRGTEFLSRRIVMNVFDIAVFATWGSSSTGKPFQLPFHYCVPLKQI